MFRIQDILLFVFLILIVPLSFLIGGAVFSAKAADASLPGDALFLHKITLEAAQANLTIDPAAQAQLYLDFAGRRLSEMKSLIKEGRYSDVTLAASEFESNIQKVSEPVRALSRKNPIQAAVLSKKLSSRLLAYNGALNETLSSLPPDIQPAAQAAIQTSQSVVDLLHTIVGSGGDNN
jgi:hypothetical protein